MVLKPRHYECIRLMLDTQMTQRDISKLIGVNDETVYRWNKDEDFQNELKKQTQLKFDKMSTRAVKELEKLVAGAESETVKLNAIKDVLDRAGYNATAKSEVSVEGVEVKIDYGE